MENQPLIKGVKFIQNYTKKFPDERGFFMELVKDSNVKNLGIPELKQINTSFSKANVVRGLHFQRGDKAQGKLVQCLSGHILDVVVDIDPKSPTFRRVEVYDLKPGQGAVYAPPQAAHGFWAIQDSIVVYACTEEYAPNSEGGINPFDRSLELPWHKVQSSFIVSAKDRNSPYLGEMLTGGLA